MDEEMDWSSDSQNSSISNQLKATSSSTTETPNRPNATNRTDSSTPAANYTRSIESKPSAKTIQSERNTRYNQIEYKSISFCNSQIASG